ncbi:MAG: tRNA dihydrouridine synthase DusB [bacterium]|nr:tRNA dihydrouridine synthase DusB [bacterium]
MLDWKTLPHPIVALSPMADMTDSAFCRVVKQFANPIVFREMVSAEAIVRGNDKTLGMIDIHSDERPLVQQIFGSDPDIMAEAARIIAAKHHPEGFDINMGCPVYKITSNFNGAALMREPERAVKIIAAVKLAITVPMSIKIRTGWSDPHECWEFAKIIEAAGADLITVHGRTKMQGYSGASDWNIIRGVKERVSIPVLANGDIHRAEQVPEALQVSGCDGVLIARGALGNPWIFSHINDVIARKTPRPLSYEERCAVVLNHARLHVEQYGPHGMVTFRKHLVWYFKGFPGAKLIRERMSSIDSLEALEVLLEQTKERAPN